MNKIKKAISLLSACIIAFTVSTAVTAQTSYTDVAKDAPYANAVAYCRDNRLMLGTSGTEFSPDENTSRAMLVTILYRSEDTPIADGTISFTDVEKGAWYYDAVRWAADTKIIEGYDAGRFGPQDTLTKEQILSILWRLNGEEQVSGVTLPYTDSNSISSYAQNAFNWAYANGIIDGETTLLSPQGAVTRADMAVIFYRYFNMPETTSPPAPTTAPSNTTEPEPAPPSPDVHVRFGSTEFDVILYESTTKQLLMAQLSPNEMLLPTSYDLDNVCKYYDIPSHYLSHLGIETEEITRVKAGDMLINAEGRLFLYYADAALTGEYMRVGCVKDKTGRELSEALGNGPIHFYVSEYIDPEENSGSVFYEPIHLTDRARSLESGLSAVRFEGEDFMDAFLSQGGATSEAEVVRFLENKTGVDTSGLELDMGGFACSTLAADGTNGGRLFGRNFDWNPCNALVTVSKPATGYASIATVNTDFIKTAYNNGFDRLPDRMRALISLYAPLDGMNEKGLCVAALMIQDHDTVRQNTGKPGITTTTAIRMLLNKAATTDEAIELLRQYDFYSSFGYMLHFAISDASGKNVAVEYVNQEMTVTETPILTNFYVSKGSKNGVGTAQSHTRFEALQNILAQNPSMTMENMKNAMENVSKKHFYDGTTTEWSIVYDKMTGIATYYHRENFDKAYTFKIS